MSHAGPLTPVLWKVLLAVVIPLLVAWWQRQKKGKPTPTAPRGRTLQEQLRARRSGGAGFEERSRG